ncbi:VOC family protein [Arthrobacter globiformis]|uniref:VOC family protein n=1 Tax=Arthrobacter globiformis TaxID=1665 RepID=UPI002785877A|nr:VOC family protein [Arthrobacter globiformis]MDQ0867303.1 catechol 2,3-dioxygenase-like lactoylglutathione lyase family enzyme [Arthrobacter globiformis]
MSSQPVPASQAGDMPAKPARGIPTARNVDHMGLTVPDLDAAIGFFVEHLGCEVAWRIGPFQSSGTSWMTDNLNVHADASCDIAMLRMGPTFNIELFQYQSPDQVQTLPKNSDWGGSHLAIYVDDIVAAVNYLRDVPGVVLQGEPKNVTDGGPTDGNRWCYFQTPWGQQMELISPTRPLGYERVTDVRMAPPAPDWAARHPYK